MGPKASAPEPLLADKNTTIKIQHPKFASAKLLTNSDSKEYISIMLPIASQKEFDQWVNMIVSGPKADSLLMPTSQKFIREGFCGSSGHASIEFEKFQFLLSNEIANRIGPTNNWFDEAELWYLLYTLLSATQAYNSSLRKVGDIRSSNVFINEEGQVKVATQFSWPNQHDNYHKSVFEKEVTYLAPEEVKDLQLSNMESTAKFDVAEAFSIGLTCLDAATLSDSTVLYTKTNKFDFQKLEQRIKAFSLIGYSELLFLTLCTMCQIDPSSRISCSDLYIWLAPKEQLITNLEPFGVGSLPDKVAAFKQGFAPVFSAPKFQMQHQPMQFEQKKVVMNGTPSPQFAGVNILSDGFTQNQFQGANFPRVSNLAIPNLNQHPHIIQAPYHERQSAVAYSKDHDDLLKKIDEQLSISRQKFPS